MSLNGIGIIVNLTEEETSNLLVFLARVQITGAEAMAVVLLRQKIEQAREAYAEMLLASRKPTENGTEPETETAKV